MYHYYDIPNNITVAVYDGKIDGYENCDEYYEEYIDILYSRDYKKRIEKDGRVYFLDFRDDGNNNYEEGEDVPIEEPSPIVTRREDLDLTNNELEELEKFKNGTVSIEQISKELMDKILIR